MSMEVFGLQGSLVEDEYHPFIQDDDIVYDTLEFKSVFNDFHLTSI